MVKDLGHKLQNNLFIVDGTNNLRRSTSGGVSGARLVLGLGSSGVLIMVKNGSVISLCVSVCVLLLVMLTE